MEQGVVLPAAEATTACWNGTPRATSSSMKSTSKIELRTMMPANAIMPIMDVAVNCAPSSAWPGMTPMMVNGMGAMITSWVK